MNDLAALNSLSYSNRSSNFNLTSHELLENEKNLNNLTNCEKEEIKLLDKWINDLQFSNGYF